MWGPCGCTAGGLTPRGHVNGLGGVLRVDVNAVGKGQVFARRRACERGGTAEYGCGASESSFRSIPGGLSRSCQQVRVGQLDRFAHNGYDLPVEACRFGGLCGEVASEVLFDSCVGAFFGLLYEP